MANLLQGHSFRKCFSQAWSSFLGSKLKVGAAILGLNSKTNQSKQVPIASPNGEAEHIHASNPLVCIIINLTRAVRQIFNKVQSLCGFETVHVDRLLFAVPPCHGYAPPKHNSCARSGAHLERKFQEIDGFA